MPEADVQALLDGVAAELGAAVSLDDVDLRLLAHTAQGEDVDDVRRTSIMGRRATADIRAWFEQFGIRDADGPVRTPADASISALPRWCVPVRFRGAHLGYVWVLGADDIGADRLGPAIDAAEQIGAILYRRRLSSQADTEHLRLLLIPNPENGSVAEDVSALLSLPREETIAVVVVGLADGSEAGPAAVSDLALAVQRAAEQHSSSVLTGVIAGAGVLLGPMRTQDALSSARRMAENARRLATHFSHGLEFVAAIGSATGLGRASHAYAEARRALRVVRAIPDLGPIVAWEELGVFRALALLPPDEVEDSVLDPRVRALFGNETLASTAEVFLDLAGNVHETATRLFLHRATLYQRLDRIAELYELDLRRNGDHRLITHLGLKLARLATLR